jgi:hypothetical protein
MKLFIHALMLGPTPSDPHSPWMQPYVVVDAYALSARHNDDCDDGDCQYAFINMTMTMNTRQS